MLLERLKKVGLTGNEAKVYLELLKQKSLYANQLSKKLSMDRTLVYAVLNQLINKGMVTYIVKDNKKFFQPVEPSCLMNTIREKEVIVKDLVHTLENLSPSQDVEHEVVVFEGIKGLRQVAKKLLASKNFCSFGATGKAYDALYELPRLAKQLTRKKNLSGRIIMGKGYKDHPIVHLKGIHCKTLNIDSKATTTIMKDTVAIHIVGDKPTVIVIKNKLVADSYLKHFEILWKHAH